VPFHSAADPGLRGRTSEDEGQQVAPPGRRLSRMRRTFKKLDPWRGIFDKYQGLMYSYCFPLKPVFLLSLCGLFLGPMYDLMPSFVSTFSCHCDRKDLDDLREKPGSCNLL